MHTMKENVAEAVKNYQSGYTCSQAVICAYADKIGLDRETAFRMFEGFGAGFGGLQEVCGAFSAAAAVISYSTSDGKLNSSQSKQTTFVKIKEAASAFEEKFSSIVCRDVLSGEKPQPLKCGEKVRIAAELVEEFSDLH